MYRIDLEDGKYTVIYAPGALLQVLRNGEPWAEYNDASVNGKWFISLLALAERGSAAPLGTSATAAAPTDASDREPDLYDEIECDLPSLFGRASLEGHESGQRLAQQVREKMQRARSATVAIPSDDDIRRVFLSNGFTVKDGQTDLKPYVYAAARVLLALFPTKATSADAMLDELHGQLYTAQRTSGDAQAKAIGNARITLSHYRSALASSPAVPPVAPVDASGSMGLVPLKPTEAMITEGLDNCSIAWSKGTPKTFPREVMNDIYVSMVRAAMKGNAS